MQYYVVFNKMGNCYQVEQRQTSNSTCIVCKVKGTKGKGMMDLNRRYRPERIPDSCVCHNCWNKLFRKDRFNRFVNKQTFDKFRQVDVLCIDPFRHRNYVYLMRTKLFEFDEEKKQFQCEVCSCQTHCGIQIVFPKNVEVQYIDYYGMRKIFYGAHNRDVKYKNKTRYHVCGNKCLTRFLRHWPNARLNGC